MVTLKGKCVGANSNCVFIQDGFWIYRYTAQGVLLYKKRLFFAVRLYIGLLLPRLIRRILRIGFVSGELCGDHLSLWDRRSLYIIDVATLELIYVFNFKGPAPLNIIYDENTNSILFGDYSSSGIRQPVQLWRFDLDQLSCESFYSFKHNLVEHVHNIKQIDFDTFIVLTGDFSQGTGIWKINFNPGLEVAPLLIGSQIFRTSAVAVVDDVLIYATDTSSDVNKLCSYNLSTNVHIVVAELPASVIYGRQINNSLVFSTNLECEISTKHSWKKWITRQLPDSFFTDNVQLFSYDNTNGLRLIAEFQDDGLPFRLFQYPTFRVHSCGGNAVFSASAIRRLDNQVAIFKDFEYL